jgi:hypothetical protein
MKRAFLREHGKAGIELIEEAFVLLRTCPPSILAAYFLGSVPFVAGFLIFCADLSRHPEAPDRLAGATLAMTLLFVWMKFFHARFGALLLARLRGNPPPAPTPGALLGSAVRQTILQSTALFLLPLSALLVVPGGWVYAFYQNVSALDDGKAGLRQLTRSALQQSALWPGQNHVILLTLSGFGFYVFLNWIMLAMFAPQLLEMFLGIETIFTQSPLSMLNTTFFAATAALTYLSIDPLIKTCYVLRCFYGQSLQSGDDLKTDIRRFSGRFPVLALCLFLCVAPPALRAAEPSPPPAVAGGELDRSISTVVQQDKYLWRTPRKKAEKPREGLLDGFFKSIVKMARDAFKALKELVEKIFEAIFGRDRQSANRSGHPGWEAPQLGLLYVILAAVACGLAIAALRTLRARRRLETVEGLAVAPVPDLADENTAADELPEDDWTRMGRQLLEQGELRLALRAFYLASLAHLASRGLITVARSKSNRDYERELLRRGHALPQLPVLFSENVGTFDRIWYGLHEVDPGTVGNFVANLEKMKASS